MKANTEDGKVPFLTNVGSPCSLGDLFMTEPQASTAGWNGFQAVYCSTEQCGFS